MTAQLDLLLKPSGRTAILMPSGFVLDLLEPVATGMPIEDIAQCLAAQPRWGGATRPWYSVAEHSVMVSRLVPPELAYDGLMHDCEEFIGDWPSPVKVLLDSEYVKKKLRPVTMATELRDLLPPHWMDWGHLPPPAPQKIAPAGPERAYGLFLARYEELKHLARPTDGAARTGKQHRAAR